MSKIKGVYAASLSVLKKDLSLDVDNTIGEGQFWAAISEAPKNPIKKDTINRKRVAILFM